MRQAFGLSFLVWLMVPMQLWAQMAMSPGDRVRVREPQVQARVWIGEFVEISGTELVLMQGGFLKPSGLVAVPLRADLLVQRNEAGFVGGVTSPLLYASLLTGAMAVSGGVISVMSDVTGPDRFEGTRSEAFLWGAAGGAVLAIPFDIMVVLGVVFGGRGDLWVPLPPPGSDGGMLALSPGGRVRVSEPRARVWIGELVDMSPTELVLMEDGSASRVSVPLRANLLVDRRDRMDLLRPALGSGVALGVVGGLFGVLNKSVGPDQFRGTRSEAFLWGAAGGATLGISVSLLGWAVGERWVALPPPGSITLRPTGGGSLGLSVVLPLGGWQPSY